MVKFVQRDVAAYTPEQKEQLRKVVIALSAEARLPAQRDLDKADAALIQEGADLLRTAMKCTDCHQFKQKDEDATAPDLTGYASREWMIDFISNPKHERFYGKRNDRMPVYGEEMDRNSIELIVDWLRGHYFHEGEIKQLKQ
jgi:ubiquinol-cytochrome c reductase cytochrome b subunit